MSDPTAPRAFTDTPGTIQQVTGPDGATPFSRPRPTTTREQAISRCLSDVARHQSGALQSLAQITSAVYDARAHLGAGAVNDLRQTSERMSAAAHGLAADLAYARGAAHILQRLAPHLDIPADLIHRAMRGDETVTTAYARHVRGEKETP